jgi:hypothetical protein
MADAYVFDVAGDILRHKKARKLARFKDKQALLGRVTYV